MPSRRAHSKSRHGCLQCKQRRVKCDEHQPICLRCKTKRLPCSYRAMLTASSSTPPETGTASTATTLPETTTTIPTQPPLPCEAEPSLNPQDLELMVQWCTHTYATLSRNHAVEWIWKSVIPRRAVHDPALMHGILALSALHLAFLHTHPRRKDYLDIAQWHHHKSISGVRNIEALSEANASAAYALSNIIIIFTFALPLLSGNSGGGEGQPSTPYDELLQIFHMSRASLKILVAVSEWVQASDLAILATAAPVGQSSTDTRASTLPAFLDAALRELALLNGRLGEDNSHHPSEVYGPVIRQLRVAFESTPSETKDGIITALFWWIFGLSSEFLDLLGEREPFAMVILAMFCTLMHRLRGQWWMDNWAEKVARDIRGSLGPSLASFVPWGLCFEDR
ncbi:Zn(II)2Cys6 transcription factor domain-containing protein [Aspergillus fijiensis CBS 313.89]|uniref:Zn(2)-C6 fungal-type domain-containing protein n=1 Tax=Aspergillus fijiensis CBS 313.89 TaxID=1448319 RepID=A0A8G1RT21_9EURO|nr:uncharacterized protein BO72DRAFT_372930 [Aspergillus fijiensis CBS 313.89]RAK79657.1 hypothetical protein BO72DRAFT_372930 [Aspergillus fijiensis CBS 313.89]